ncbi:hypothetical protein EDC96DRAFT_597206 [Choanephora cucurbitarum]|nr:hypothetical protein EDC96DRAFT_597206 [Choanephora cucurbitarum]
MSQVTPETITNIQSQLLETQQLLQRLVLQTQTNAVYINTSATSSPDMEEVDKSALVHSIAVRQQLEWTPPEELTEMLNLKQSPFISSPMPDTQRRELIESYPPMRNMDYRAPSTLPAAPKQMNKGQQHEDIVLREAQYLLTGVLRPLDILGYEIYSVNIADNDAQRFLQMIHDVRSLLLNVSYTLNHHRNNIALRSFNQSFALPSQSSDARYTMPLSDFNASIAQQTATEKSLKEARNLSQNKGKTSRRFQKKSTADSPPSFTLAGPS